MWHPPVLSLANISRWKLAWISPIKRNVLWWYRVAVSNIYHYSNNTLRALEIIKVLSPEKNIILTVISWEASLARMRNDCVINLRHSLFQDWVQSPPSIIHHEKRCVKVYCSHTIEDSTIDLLRAISLGNDLTIYCHGQDNGCQLLNKSGLLLLSSGFFAHQSNNFLRIKLFWINLVLWESSWSRISVTWNIPTFMSAINL